MTKQEILTQIQITIVDAVENCNDAYVSRGAAHDEAVEAYEQVVEYIEELLDEQLKNISRVEVVTKHGRDYTRWAEADRIFKVSLQDSNKTIKLFEVARYGEDNE